MAVFSATAPSLVAADGPASDPVLATLGLVEIRESDFRRFVEHSYAGAQATNLQNDLVFRRNALEAYLDLRAAAAKARKEGIDRLPTFQKARELMEMKLLVSLFDQRDRARVGLTNSITNRMERLRAEMDCRETPVARTNVSLLDPSAVPADAILAYVAGEPVREADFQWFIKDAYRAEQRMHAFSRPGAREALLEAFLQMRVIQARARKDGLQNQAACTDAFAVLELRLLAEFLQERDRRNPWNVPGSTDEARMGLMKAYFAGLRAEMGLREAQRGVQARDLTFFAVSDTHYGLSPGGNRAVPGLVDAMNALPGTAYPPSIGGTVGAPRGVVHTGDITSDGKEEQWRLFVDDYGLDAAGGRLRYPVYETCGNHDGGPKSPVRAGIRGRNASRAGLLHVSTNRLHCHWNWDGIHFIQLGIAPGSTNSPYDPEFSMEFLSGLLATNIPEREPIILLHHFGFDKSHSMNWWSDERRAKYAELLKGRNVVAIIHGHAHEPLIYQWEGFDVYHPPHFRQKNPREDTPVTHGLFVFHVTDDQLTVAERRLDGSWGMTATKYLRNAPVATQPVSGKRDVTFISASDTHYREPDHPRGSHNDLNRASVEEINRLAGTPWPQSLGGTPISKPRGVLVLGDVIDDGDAARAGRKISGEQFKFFLGDFGLDGTDGLLNVPVFEGWGNHDGPPEGREKHGFSFQGELRKRNQLRLAKGFISRVSENGLHYSWDWDDVHFVQLNIYPADRQCDGVRYSPVWHDPQGALTFLKDDLAAAVGDSGRPVVLMSHCGFDTDWWVKEDWAAVHAAAKRYNVVLYLYGHSGTGIREWSPDGQAPKWNCINDGQAGNGFFVIQVTADRLRAAFRCKSGVKTTKTANGGATQEWPGTWEWKWLLDKPISSPPRAATATR